VIEPYDWADKPNAVARSLCMLPDQAGTPWLSFTLESETGVELVTPARMGKLGVSEERLEHAAIANLSRVPASWTPRWVPAPDGHEVDVLFCHGEPHAGERILETPFLLHAQSMLGSNALAASVPQRGMLLVTRLTDLTVLMSLARHYFENPDTSGLSPWGFALQDGKISGPISSG
jgi:hypothetical protein